MGKFVTWSLIEHLNTIAKSEDDHEINIQIATQFDPLPSDVQLIAWARIAMRHVKKSTELTIRIVDIPEIQTLNRTYRNKDKPTNVLAFPAEVPDELNIPLLGDIIICAPIIWEEAQQQHKDFEAHFAHMVIHGCLHLLGYDHVTPEQANEMEPLEIELLKALHFPNPYQENSHLWRQQ